MKSLVWKTCGKCDNVKFKRFIGAKLHSACENAKFDSALFIAMAYVEGQSVYPENVSLNLHRWLVVTLYVCSFMCKTSSIILVNAVIVMWLAPNIWNGNICVRFIDVWFLASGSSQKLYQLQRRLCNKLFYSLTSLLC